MSSAPPGLGLLLEDASVLDVFSGKRPWVLALDYDGTLAPFRPERDHARPYAGLRDVLNRLPTAGPSLLVLISGREAQALSRLLNLHPVPEIWGCHGAQRLAPGSPPTQPPLSPAQSAALAEAEALVDDASLLERKPCGLALHWRGLAQERAARLEADLGPALRKLAVDAGLELHPFDGGLELRLPGFDKGGAIRTLLREHPEALVFYLGDDNTDEDAFLALKDHGIGILVRRLPRPTSARYWIKPPQELLAFLGRFTSLSPPRRSMRRES